MVKTRTVRVASCFPASVDAVWEKLRRIDTLQYIAAPYAAFTPVRGATLAWEEGRTLAFHLTLFGFLSLGIHTISVKQLDADALVILTRESNRFVPVWNHRIALQKTDHEGMCLYSDEIEVLAGWKTPAVAAWGRLFYRHRQKRWLKLLR